MSPATYNRNAIGRQWTLADIPVEWIGYQILLRGDTDHDTVIDRDEIDRVDWIAFSEAVQDFQKLAKLKAADQDGKLGPTTLGLLKKQYAPKTTPANGAGNGTGSTPAGSILRQFGDLTLCSPSTLVCQPSGPKIVGHTPEEKAIADLWNNYGKAIAEQATEMGIPVESALGVFYVESKKAFDLGTGLVLLRYEPHIFRRKSGRDVPARRGGQRDEWDNFERAYAVHPEAALASCSYGLPQLMGFNYGVTKHGSARDMVLAFQDSCSEQVAGFFGFVKANKLTKAIVSKDWRAFTKVYNGPGNVDDYSGKLNRAMKVIDSLKQDGATFTA